MKKIVLFLVLILLSVIWIVIGVKSKVDYVDVLVFKENNNIISTFETKEELIVPVYFSVEETYYTHKENVLSSYLKNDNNQMLIENTEIKKVGKCKIEGKRYYEYSFVFSIIYSDEELLKIPDGKVIVNYEGGSQLILEIGNLCIKKIPFSHDENNLICLKSIEGMTAEVDNVKTLIAIVLCLELQEGVKLERMDLYDYQAKISNSEVLQKEDVGYLNDIDEVLGYDYDKYEYYDGVISGDVNGKGKIIFPIKMSNNLNKAGFELIYSYNEKYYSFYYPTFMFFQELNKNGEYKINTYALC